MSAKRASDVTRQGLAVLLPLSRRLARFPFSLNGAEGQGGRLGSGKTASVCGLEAP